MAKLGSNVINGLTNKEEDGIILNTIVSFPHLFYDIHWYVPCPKQYIRHGNIHKAFKPSLWLLLLSVFILSTLITVFIHKTVKADPSKYNEISYGFYSIWAILTSVSVPRMPASNKLRILFMMWVLFSMIISTVFQSFFTSYLIEPGTEKQISTLKEILNSNLTILGDAGMFFMWHVMETKGISELFKERGNKIKMLDNAIEEYFRIKNSVLAAIDLEMKIKLYRYARYMKTCNFLELSQIVHTINFIPYSPFYESYNTRIVQYFEGGIFKPLIDNFTSSTSFSSPNITQFEDKLKIEANQSDEYFILNFHHLNVAFYALIIGYVTSCVIFICEIFIVHYPKIA
ncbi:hypothetical protein L9F63_008145 [Diploptera punctata]|uniref:Ionotropic glutamate receptor C-terminal domain-containing protein n=1 Tax=Diploptera punctata TaxID=6984 RepID=A0AAD7Z5X6_DIPPU|nr:hypothetical protein L9F63_008145 [Diploptera punctata]